MLVGEAKNGSKMKMHVCMPEEMFHLHAPTGNTRHFMVGDVGQIHAGR